MQAKLNTIQEGMAFVMMPPRSSALATALAIRYSSRIAPAAATACCSKAWPRCKVR